MTYVLCCKYCGCYYPSSEDTYSCCLISKDSEKEVIKYHMGIMGCPCPCHWYLGDEDFFKEIVKEIFNLVEKPKGRKKNGV